VKKEALRASKCQSQRQSQWDQLNDWWDMSSDVVDASKIIQYLLCVSKNRGTPKWMVYNGKDY